MATLFDIDHETGDLSQYDLTVTDGGDLSVSNAAALAGTTWGLSVFIDDTNAIYAMKNNANPGTGHFRMRFYLDPNGLVIPVGNGFMICRHFLSGAPWAFFMFELLYIGSNYNLRFYTYKDGALLGLDTEVITDDVHYIELYYKQASDAVSADGSVEWWIDGSSKNVWNNVDNFDLFSLMNNVRFGAPQDLDAGTAGILYIDEIKANNDGSEIGPVAAAAAKSRHSRPLWIEHPERFSGLRRYSIY